MYGQHIVIDLGLGIWDLGVGSLHSGCQQLRRDRALVRKRLQRGFNDRAADARHVAPRSSDCRLQTPQLPLLKRTSLPPHQCRWL